MNEITLFLAKLFDKLKSKSPLVWAIICAVSAAVIWLSANNTIQLPPWVMAIIALITGAGGSRTTNIIKESEGDK